MNTLRRVFYRASTLFAPVRGHYLQGKWQKVIQKQKYHDQKWKKLQSSQALQMTKVPAVESFRVYINENPLVKMYLQAGLDAIPETVEQFYETELGTIPAKSRSGVCHGYSWEQLLDTFDSICRTPPKFEDFDIIGVPFYAMVVDLLNTEHGRFFFSIPEVNHHLKLIFDSYGEMLDSPASLKHMNAEEGGWLSPTALKRIDYADFECDPQAPHYGFKSWHEWFTRKIKQEARPFSDNENEIINNSESFPYGAPTTNVQWNEKFWLKDQKYALSQIFNAGSLSEEEQAYYKDNFVGGTVYQGFLNPWCYHRWRSPISGVIEKCYTAGHSYYVGNPSLSPSLKQGYIASQPLLSMVSGRQIYIIKADNPKIGHIAVVQIGMVEVSGIKNLVQEGQRINKGDLLGYFRFGGSSHIIIFGNKASNLTFNPTINDRVFNPETQQNGSVLQKVRSPLAWVR